MPTLSISIGRRNFALFIPNQAIVLCGAASGILLIAGISQYNERRRAARTRAQQNASRLHRRRALRRRRQLNNEASNQGGSNDDSPNYDSPLRIPFLDTEEDGEDSLLLSSFKEWTEADESKTLLNLLYAIAENQSRKGKHSMSIRFQINSILLSKLSLNHVGYIHRKLYVQHSRLLF